MLHPHFEFVPPSLSDLLNDDERNLAMGMIKVLQLQPTMLPEVRGGVSCLCAVATWLYQEAQDQLRRQTSFDPTDNLKFLELEFQFHMHVLRKHPDAAETALREMIDMLVDGGFSDGQSEAQEQAQGESKDT